ncbi:Uncharacterised protein [Zhongshania aliphaticivorans]|uniref:Uncharacterized protein n=1 Tax=Zhongshania aliphaticivorans TaxID=1470434 RepID=A0A5S9N7U7_9GAMM|nr:hypothetical protein [Zhongshania aliphaticivorans]CAA0081226.1 Uncharacterised protein [Zhongshania aliphaticivorans]CAA0085043.1 Uncharacterised protein [Zhongshania aliphaticivorans]
MSSVDYTFVGGGKALAAGEYVYYLNDELQAIKEQWCRYEQDGGIELIESSRALTDVFELRSQAILSEGMFKQVRIQWRAEQDVDVFYDNEAGVCYRQIDGQEQPETVLPAGPIYPLMRIYTAALIQHIAKCGGNTQVVIPDIRPASSAQEKLLPLLTSRQCEYLGDEVISTETMEIPCERWTFKGDQYSSGDLFYINRAGILARYCWQQDSQSQWRVELRHSISGSKT